MIPCRDVRAQPRAIGAQHTHGQDRRLGCHADDARAVLGGTDDAGHVRAVTVGVGATGADLHRTVVDDGDAGQDMATEVGMVRLDSRVHDGDRHAGAATTGPEGGERVGVQRPLVLHPRVGGGHGGRYGEGVGHARHLDRHDREVAGGGQGYGHGVGRGGGDERRSAALVHRHDGDATRPCAFGLRRGVLRGGDDAGRRADGGGRFAGRRRARLHGGRARPAAPGHRHRRRRSVAGAGRRGAPSRARRRRGGAQATSRTTTTAPSAALRWRRRRARSVSCCNTRWPPRLTREARSAPSGGRPRAIAVRLRRCVAPANRPRSVTPRRAGCATGCRTAVRHPRS